MIYHCLSMCRHVRFYACMYVHTRTCASVMLVYSSCLSCLRTLLVWRSLSACLRRGAPAIRFVLPREGEGGWRWNGGEGKKGGGEEHGGGGGRGKEEG